MVINLYKFYCEARKKIGRDALYLLEYASGYDKAEILAGKEIDIKDETYNNINSLIEKRENGEPLQYLTGRCEFFGLDFEVGEGVLIPRADTEISVEEVLKLCPENAKIADLCSGSGCIAISIKKNKPNAEIYAYEISDKAITYLQKNAKINNSDIKIIKADVLKDPKEKDFDIIISNPPYLTNEDMQNLQQEVTFEPKSALYGGGDGLDFYRNITRIWADKIKNEGYLIYEIGINQQDAVSEILLNSGFCEIKQIKDLSGIIRVIIGKRRKY